jgi:probable phosphoglycerate mutase
MTQLILVRHGETVWNTQRRMQGYRDSPLSALGLWQARQLARRLARQPFSALYSSDLGRAHRTAGSIAEATGHAIIADAGLRERHFGVFEGLTAAEIENGYPEEYARFRSRDPDYVVPGGESARVFRDRCMASLERIARHHRAQTVVIVTHGLVLDMAYRAAQGLPLDAQRPVPLLNASLNVFSHAGGWRLESWGDVAHLTEAEAGARGNA